MARFSQVGRKRNQTRLISSDKAEYWVSVRDVIEIHTSAPPESKASFRISIDGQPINPDTALSSSVKNVITKLAKSSTESSATSKFVTHASAEPIQTKRLKSLIKSYTAKIEDLISSLRKDQDTINDLQKKTREVLATLK
jgi:hypothetical protein